MKKNKKIEFRDLGILEYTEAFEMQEKLMQKIIDKKTKNCAQEKETEFLPNYFLFVEHPHIYTLGKSGNEKNMLVNSDKLKEIGARYIRTNRGGDITYHGYGQIVGYPILDLDNFTPDIRLYMRNLEEVIIRVLADYSITGTRSEGETGVWLDAGKPYARKICALGVRTSKWVTMHGFAFNVDPDIKYFEYIIPCGIKDKAVTSLGRELERKILPPEREKIKEKIKRYFLEVFHASL
ncbi:MAG: lipoyl(octanoyl) transferase LipB [Bergeyella sp.]|nr:lipoyl(octanoyl) transferase LipB [Bergeyella sp.]